MTSRSVRHAALTDCSRAQGRVRYHLRMTSPASHVESECSSRRWTRPVGRWLESANIPGYSVVETGVKEVRDTYLDTTIGRLHRAGYTCRGSEGRVR